MVDGIVKFLTYIKVVKEAMDLNRGIYVYNE